MSFAPDLPLVPVFTTRDVLERGLPPSRVRRSDVLRLARGIHRRRDMPLRTWESAGLPPPHHGVGLDLLTALLRSRPDAVLSHETAAHLHGLPLPPGGATRRAAVEITLHRGTARARIPGVMEHRRPLPAGHVTSVLGLRVTTPERTWLDLCSIGHPWDEASLVSAGDHLVRHPWSPRGRRPPITTVTALHEAMRPLGRFVGRPRATAALERVRVGADSPQETRLRLELVEAGLGEPTLQHVFDPGRRDAPEADLWFEDCRLVLQYDGEVHRSAEQHARDARRDQYYAERGQMTLHVTGRDVGEGYARVIEAVLRRRAQVSNGWDA